MQANHDHQRRTLAYLYPEPTPGDRQAVQANLERYLLAVWAIYRRLRKERDGRKLPDLRSF